MRRPDLWLLRLIPLVVLLCVWQIWASSSPRATFLFGSPRLVLRSLLAHLADGTLAYDSVVTGSEALMGFLCGIIIGSTIGFGLLYSPTLASISRPYVLALGSVPVFGVAPMLIIWFGINIKMKIAMAFFSTVLVALSQAYEGGKAVDPELKILFELNNSSRGAMFRKLILPSSMNWVLASLKINIGLALLGAFIGEFIASERGLGHLILQAGGIYDVPLVLAAAVCVVILAFCLNFMVVIVERRRHRLIEVLTVPRRLWSESTLPSRGNVAEETPGG